MHIARPLLVLLGHPARRREAGIAPRQIAEEHQRRLRHRRCDRRRGHARAAAGLPAMRVDRCCGIHAAIGQDAAAQTGTGAAGPRIAAPAGARRVIDLLIECHGGALIRLRIYFWESIT